MEFLTFAGALAFGTFAFWMFWVVAFVIFLALVGLAEKEHYGWASVVFVAAFVGLALTGTFNLYQVVLYNPWSVAKFVAGYLGAGVIWGVVKWFFYCKKHRRLYDVALADFNKANPTLSGGDLKAAWTLHLQESNRYTRSFVLHANPPEASNNKEKIMNWMYLWPFSMVGTAFSELLFKIWDRLYEMLGGVYDSIAQSIWKGTENDLASEVELAAYKAKTGKR